MVRVLTGAIALCSLFAGLLLPRCAEAAIIVYTDRATWESAVGALTTENFNSFANLTPVTPATIFPSGIVVNGTDTDISSFAFSDIGQGNALRAFETFTVTMPGSVVAFGFDYADQRYCQ